MENPYGLSSYPNAYDNQNSVSPEIKTLCQNVNKQLPLNNKNLTPKLTYPLKLYAPWQLTQTSLTACKS